jgi:hypothetical protein
MTRDEARAEVQKVLGYRNDKQAEIEFLLLHQQKEMEHQPTLPWFLREETLTMTSVAGDERMALPAGFLKEWQDDPMRIRVVDDTTGLFVWRKLSKDTPEYLRDTLQSAGTPGIPQAYNRDAVSFILYPTPDDIYTFRMIYYKEDAPLTSDIENKWLKNLPYLLIGLAGMRVSGASRDKEAMQTFGMMVQEGSARINNWNTELDEAGARPVVGGPD